MSHSSRRGVLLGIAALTVAGAFSASAEILPPFVIVGDEVVTDPNEVQMVLLYRSLPERMKPAFGRFCQNVTTHGLPLREAMIVLGLEWGQDHATATRHADMAIAAGDAT